jgi:hypothetical protein
MGCCCLLCLLQVLPEAVAVQPSQLEQGIRLQLPLLPPPLAAADTRTAVHAHYCLGNEGQSSRAHTVSSTSSSSSNSSGTDSSSKGRGSTDSSSAGRGSSSSNSSGTDSSSNGRGSMGSSRCMSSLLQHLEAEGFSLRVVVSAPDSVHPLIDTSLSEIAAAQESAWAATAAAAVDGSVNSMGSAVRLEEASDGAATGAATSTARAPASAACSSGVVSFSLPALRTSCPLLPESCPLLLVHLVLSSSSSSSSNIRRRAGTPEQQQQQWKNAQCGEEKKHRGQSQQGVCREWLVSQLPLLVLPSAAACEEVQGLFECMVAESADEEDEGKEAVVAESAAEEDEEGGEEVVAESTEDEEAVAVLAEEELLQQQEEEAAGGGAGRGVRDAHGRCTMPFEATVLDSDVFHEHFVPFARDMATALTAVSDERQRAAAVAAACHAHVQIRELSGAVEEEEEREGEEEMLLLPALSPLRPRRRKAVTSTVLSSMHDFLQLQGMQHTLGLLQLQSCSPAVAYTPSSSGSGSDCPSSNMPSAASRAHVTCGGPVQCKHDREKGSWTGRACAVPAAVACGKEPQGALEAAAASSSSLACEVSSASRPSMAGKETGKHDAMEASCSSSTCALGNGE